MSFRLPRAVAAGCIYQRCPVKKSCSIPKAGMSKRSTSSEEIALAGKGFNQQVEQEYKKQNRNVDFSWVDKMEQIVIPQQEMQTFLQQGGLAPTGGKS